MNNLEWASNFTSMVKDLYYAIEECRYTEIEYGCFSEEENTSKQHIYRNVLPLMIDELDKEHLLCPGNHVLLAFILNDIDKSKVDVLNNQDHIKPAVFIPPFIKYIRVLDESYYPLNELDSKKEFRKKIISSYKGFVKEKTTVISKKDFNIDTLVSSIPTVYAKEKADETYEVDFFEFDKWDNGD